MVGKPQIIAHSDWSMRSAKRWCARAVLIEDGRYAVQGPKPVGLLGEFLPSIEASISDANCAFLGFDFPIGIPHRYAQLANIASFIGWIEQLGTGQWGEFFDVCEEGDEISFRRPFFPNASKAGIKQFSLLNALGVASIDELMRRCELGTKERKRACSIFWTLGGNQVGKAAIVGWRDVIIPVLHRAGNSVGIWPFDGTMSELLKSKRLTIAETYPAEYYQWFTKDRVVKTNVTSRIEFCAHLLDWLHKHESELLATDDMKREIRSGFADDDRFDSVVGLFAMLQVVLGERPVKELHDQVAQTIEGAILGRD